MKSRIGKLISLALVIAMLVQLAPLNVFATDKNVSGAEEPVLAANMKQELLAEDIQGEDPDRREETVKHFRMQDGSFIAVDYGYAVHYQDSEGAYQEIDNRLVLTEAETAEEISEIATTDRNGKISFSAESTDDRALVSFGSGDTEIKMTPYAAPMLSAVTENRMEAESEEELQLASAMETKRENYAQKAIGNVVLSGSEGLSTHMAIGDAQKLMEALQPMQMNAAEADIQEAAESMTEELSLYDAVFPEKSRSSLVYSDIFPDVDLEYILEGNNLKENIIVKKRTESYVYPFLTELGEGMTMELQDNGSALVLKDGTPVYEIGVPCMFDANGEFSSAVSYVIKELDEGKYLLITVADAEWINEEGRAFPVVVDPSVYIYNAEPTMSASYICSTAAEYEFRYDGYLYIGEAYTGAVYRTVLRMNTMPTLPMGSTIIGAQLQFGIAGYSNNGQNSLQIVAQPIADGDDFWSGVRSWNNRPQLDPSILDYETVDPYIWQMNFDITREFVKWMDDSATNNGLMIYTTDEETMTSTKCSYIYAYSTSNPLVVVNYRNTMGVEDYYTYQVQDIGRAGTAYVGDYTGGITLINGIVSDASTIAPVGVSMVYNSAMTNQLYQDFVYSYDYGFYSAGWKLNCVQSVHTSDDGTRLVYIDGDGTTHYFAWDSNVGRYVDEDGLGLRLAKDDSNYTMTDRYGNIKYFYSNMLYFEEDANGNRIFYNVAYGTVSTVSRQLNGHNTETICTFQYDPTTKYLTSITDKTGNVTSFTYSTVAGMKRLTGITYPDGKTVSYSYDANGRLSRAKDNESGYSVNYAYYSNGRVKSIEEMSGTTAGTKIIASGTSNGLQAYCYPGSDRKVSKNDYFNENAASTCGCAGTACNCDDDNILTYCVFDYYGRTINTYSTDAAGSVIYGVNSTKYVTNSGTSGANNRINVASSVGVQPENYAADGGFESGTSIISGSVSCTYSRGSTLVHTGGYALKINPAAESGAKAQASVAGLASGKYIVSAYVRFAEGGNGSAAIISGAASGSRANNASSGSDWERIYVVADAVEDPTWGYTLDFAIAVEGSVDVYVDDIQVEPCLTGQDGAPSGVNLLKSGNFNGNNAGWGTVTIETVDFVSGSINAAKLTGKPGTTRELTQRVTLNLDAGQTYMLSAWAMASSGPISSADGFGLVAIINYEGGATEKHEEAFCVDYEGWQYLAMPIVPKGTAKVKSIDVKLCYNSNINTVHFSKAALVREAVAIYKYNIDGDLVAANETNNAGQTYTYSGADLIGETTKGSGNYNYTYDSRHNVTGVSHDTTSMAITYNTQGNVTSSTLTSTTQAGQITSSSTYTTDQNRVASVTDARGKTTSYVYDGGIYTMLGAPSSVTDAKGTTVTTTRNEDNGRVTQSGISGEVNLTYGYNGDGTLGSITRNSHAPGSSTMTAQTYTMSYTANFDRLQSVKVGSRTLASYVYENNGVGQMTQMNYGNGDTVGYAYDVLERLSQTSYNDRGSVNYYYNGMGALGKVVDGETGHSYYYNYDSLGRLISMTEENGVNGVQSYSASYDNANRLSSYRYRVSSNWTDAPGALRTFSYTYSNTDGTLTELSGPAGRQTYAYDGFNRLSGKTTYAAGSANTDILQKQYTYLAGANGGTTNLVSNLRNLDGNGNLLSSFTYGYDNVGNIVSISGGGENRTYTYDAQGQMLTEKIGSTTYTYAYDSAGNIRSKTSGGTTKSYTYGDSSWKDLLTNYNGLAINYDGVGNPTNWRGLSSLTWESGRRLMSATTTSGTNLSYTYDMDGLRLSKTVGSTEHKYVWQGSRLLSESWGDKTLEFFYDESGVPYAFNYKVNNDAADSGYYYYYVTNLQGDVIAIMDASGTVVATYQYDAWGSLISAEPAANSIGAINPLRYRGYYYDQETRLYYLQSRYYDSEVCRFINADGYASTGQGFLGHNMFAYCNNNPVNYTDTCGTEPIAIIGSIVVGALLVAVVASPGFQEAAKDASEAIADALIRADEKARGYTVYMLVDKNNQDDGIVYVGRVKTEDYEARMAYHEKHGRARYKKIDGLTYGECRGMEQILMTYYHTLRRGEGLYNQIRGVGPRNKKGVFYIWVGLEYIANQLENEYLNLKIHE